MADCEFWKECFNAGYDLLCEDCDQTEATFKLTDPKEIKKAWDDYVEYCWQAMERRETEVSRHPVPGAG